MKILIYLIICLVPFCGESQTLNNQLLKDSIEVILKQKNISGAYVSIVKKDSILFQEGIGIINKEKGIRADEQHLFRLGSVSKTFTALVIMNLVKDGKLNLEDDIRKIVPEIHVINKWEDSHPIKLKHVLEHKAGFDDIHLSALSKISKKPEGTLMIDEVLFFNKCYKANWKPGLVMSYSNPGYVLLGYIIEKISGHSYQDYIRENILRPLKMNNTRFISEIIDKDKIVTGYSNNTGRVLPIPKNQRFYGETGGGLLSNAEDMSKFLQFLLKPDSVSSSDFLGVKEILEMEQLHSQLELSNNIKFGYSIGIQDRLFGQPQRVFKGHSGLIDGFVSNFIYNREYDIGISVTTNSFGVSNRPIIDLIVNIIYAKNFEVQESQIDKTIDLSKFKDWEGEHRQLNEDNEVYHFLNFPIRAKKISFEKEKLIISEFLGDREEYFYIGNNAFKDKEELLPTVYLTDFEGEKSLYYYGKTFVTANEFIYTLVRTLLIMSLIIGLIFIVVFVIQLILMFFKKTTKNVVLRTFYIGLPYMLVIVSTIVFFKYYYSYDSIKYLGEVSIVSVSIFVMTLIFPITCFWAGITLYKQWNTIERVYVKLFNGIGFFGSVFITGYCLIFGWFALSLWM